MSKKSDTKSSKRKKSHCQVEPEPPCEEPKGFPIIKPFPSEGIAGMYPIFSACKRDVAQHMVKFQRRLEEEYYVPPVTVNSKMTDFKSGVPLEEAYERVADQMAQLECDIAEVKHKLAVESIKKKYSAHEEYCPCYKD